MCFEVYIWDHVEAHFFPKVLYECASVLMWIIQGICTSCLQSLMEGMPLYHQKMFTQGGMDFNDEMSTLLSYVPRNPLPKMFS